MKTSTIAAALIAATAAAPAAAHVKICVPVASYIDTTTGKAAFEVLANCDATAINKKFKLKTNELGCATAGQFLYDSKDYTNGDVSAQAAIIVEKNEKPIACTEGEMAAFWVEL